MITHKIIALALSFTAFQAESAIIFKAEDYCSVKQWGLLYQCESLPGTKEVTIEKDQVTNTRIEALAFIPLKNQISYKFNCDTPDKFNVWLSLGDDNLPLLWNAAGKIETTSHLRSQDELKYSLHFETPDQSIPIRDGCSLDVLSNMTLPDVDALRIVIALLSHNYMQLADLKKSIDDAAELPAKWTIIKDSPRTIEDLSNNLDFEINALQQELDALKLADPATLSENDRIRLTGIPGVIESYQNMNSDLSRLKHDLGNIAGIAAKCDANVSETFCMENLANVSAILTASMALKKAELLEINQFLKTESDRLKTISISVSNALRRLLSKLD